MNLANLIQDLHASSGVDRRLVADSRRVRSGDIFVCTLTDPNRAQTYISQAVAAGASKVIADQSLISLVHAERLVLVPGLSANLATLAAQFYGLHEQAPQVVAVTGTNGKTSCTQWIAQGLFAMCGSSAVVGTLGAGAFLPDGPSELEAFGLTTPDVVLWHEWLARFRALGVATVAVEASSIGLHQRRLDGAPIVSALFTNLTQDHLDYHGDFDAYRQAKALLFARPELRNVIVNLDDPASGQMLDAVTAPMARRIGYHLAPMTASVAAAATNDRHIDGVVTAENVTTLADGFQFDLVMAGQRAPVRLPLLGRYNLSNALAVSAVWWCHGASVAECASWLAALRPVPGRLEAVPAQRGPLVVVDYAHTPDALYQVLATMRESAQVRGGQLLCVFGAGGDRDPGKRPLMGQQAERGADIVWITSDNPRSEDPASIAQQILGGMQRQAKIELDRAKAITGAVLSAARADVVVIAGKGHETTQEIAGVNYPFRDQEVARKALEQWSEAQHA